MDRSHIEHAFPIETDTFGHEAVWKAWRWVCEHEVIAGQTTLGEAKRLTRERLSAQRKAPPTA